MPRLSESGKWIFSAGEVAEFVVCPESWRLRRRERRGSNLHGEVLHEEWADKLERSNALFLAVRVTTTLAILGLLIFLGLKIGN